MSKIQRFGGAMLTPVLTFAFFGLVVGLTIVLMNEDLFKVVLLTPDKDHTLYWKILFVIQEGAWVVFRNMPLMFAVGLPIGLATKAHARACFEVFVIYMVYNYFISALLMAEGVITGTNWDIFSVAMDEGYKGDLSFAGGGGLKVIGGVPTIDTSIIGALIVAGVVVYLHNRFFDTKLPDWLGIFSGTVFVIILGFFTVIPMAFITYIGWPVIQHGIGSLQDFMKTSGPFGIWLYTFLERILIPTGLHHFIYTPFINGPAVTANGIAADWPQFIQGKEIIAGGDAIVLDTTKSLKDQAWWGGFALHGHSKIWGTPGIAAALVATAKKEHRKEVLSLVTATTLTAVVTGITEPIEFTFLFVAPFLFAIHAVLAATLATTEYMFGIVGNMGGGVLDFLFQNWLPLGKYYWETYLVQIGIGFVFTAIYFFVFRYFILKFDLPTPGRTDEEAKLVSKAEYRKAKGKDPKTGEKADSSYKIQAIGFMTAFGGPENIKDISNCATRLRVTVNDPSKVGPDSAFREFGAHGVVRNGQAMQIIVGLTVPSVREEFERLK